MRKGTSITLRPVRESDLNQLYAFHVDIDNRGEFRSMTLGSHASFTTRSSPLQPGPLLRFLRRSEKVAKRTIRCDPW